VYFRAFADIDGDKYNGRVGKREHAFLPYLADRAKTTPIL
jgi:hypothetical protein